MTFSITLGRSLRSLLNRCTTVDFFQFLKIQALFSGPKGCVSRHWLHYILPIAQQCVYIIFSEENPELPSIWEGVTGVNCCRATECHHPGAQGLAASVIEIWSRKSGLAYTLQLIVPFFFFFCLWTSDRLCTWFGRTCWMLRLDADSRNQLWNLIWD